MTSSSRTIPPRDADRSATRRPAVANVSDTARWVAAYRARESARPDALFHDPFAARLAGEQGEAIAARAPREVRNGWPVIARTRAIDDFVLAAIADGCDCVLNLAAGLDTRPYRLALPPSLPWIEADLPGIIDEKAAALAGETPRCRLDRRKVDLADPAARSAFLDSAIGEHRNVLVITEGLLMYLDEDTVSGLARALDRPGVHWWVFDILSPVIRDGLMRRMADDLGNARMSFAPASGVAFFEALGWTVLDVRSAFAEARRLRRLPWFLNLIAMLPAREPDPRNLAKERWSGIACLARSARELTTP